jgi:protein arginine N-methyltransferase 1
MTDDLQSDEYYYEQRAHYSFHELILKDYEPMNVWRQVLSYNPLQIRDKTVLDIGSGPGVFSLLAARAGARHVYAWEPSVQSVASRQIIADNAFADTITVLTGPIEAVVLPEQVDVLFTSAFGYSLYLESLIPQFLHARDRLLKPGGAVLPSRYTVLIAGYSPSRFASRPFWASVYGYDFTPIARDAAVTPFKTLVAASRLCTEEFSWAGTFERGSEIGIRDGEFAMKVTREADMMGIVVWFDILYRLAKQTRVLGTGPNSPDTHWMQICLPFPEPLRVKIGDVIAGKLAIVPEAPEMRKVVYELECRLNDGAAQKRQYIYR